MLAAGPRAVRVFGRSCVDPMMDHETIHAKRGSSTRGFSRRALQWRPDSYRRLLSIHPHRHTVRGARVAGVLALRGVVRQPGNSLTWHLFMPLLLYGSQFLRVQEPLLTLRDSRCKELQAKGGST